MHISIHVNVSTPLPKCKGYFTNLNETKLIK